MKREMLDPTQTDYILLLFKLWDARMFLLKTSMVGLLIGILIFISIPKEYETSIYTVPESTSGKIDTDEGFSSEVEEKRYKMLSFQAYIQRLLVLPLSFYHYLTYP